LGAAPAFIESSCAAGNSAQPRTSHFDREGQDRESGKIKAEHFTAFLIKMEMFDLTTFLKSKAFFLNGVTDL